MSFAGTVSIENGEVESIEYSLNGGSGWTVIPTDQNRFVFVTPALVEGNYTVLARAKSKTGVYTQSGNYAASSVTLATTPPQVTLDLFRPNPTKDTTPTVSGTARSRLVAVTRVEISLDEGQSWTPVDQTQNTFTHTFSKLEDGNYPVQARAQDAAGNLGVSTSQTLIVDTIPPLIGGSLLALGTQTLSPSVSSTFVVPKHSEITFVTSVKGGPIEVILTTGPNQAQLEKIAGTNLWKGIAKLDKRPDQAVEIKFNALDGAGNRTERIMAALQVEEPATVTDSQSGQALDKAQVPVWQYDQPTETWRVWDGPSFGQVNPQLTDPSGEHGFYLPAGKYYLEVKKFGYRANQSTIFNLGEDSLVAVPFQLDPSPGVNLNLPFWGPVLFNFSPFIWPTTTDFTSQSQSSSPSPHQSALTGQLVPEFTLPLNQAANFPSSELKGKKTALVFISPWSPLAEEQSPVLQDLWSKLTAGQAVYGVMVQESSSAAAAYMQRGRYNFPLLIDANGQLASLLQVGALPYFVFLDTTGQVTTVYSGVLDKDQLIEILSQLK